MEYEIVLCEEEDSVKVSGVQDFEWSGRSETEATPDFLDHIAGALRVSGVNMGRGGYKILDKHSCNKEFTLYAGSTQYRGGIDGWIVPYNIADVSAGWQIRAGIELKTKKKNLDAMLPQATLEYLAATAYSRHPVALMLTNGAECKFLRPIGDRKVAQASYSTLAGGIGALSRYLQEF